MSYVAWDCLGISQEVLEDVVKDKYVSDFVKPDATSTLNYDNLDDCMDGWVDRQNKFVYLVMHI